MKNDTPLTYYQKAKKHEVKNESILSGINFIIGWCNRENKEVSEALEAICEDLKPILRKKMAMLTFIAFLGSCKPDPCEQFNYGTGCFNNDTPYYITVDIDGSTGPSLSPYEIDCWDEMSTGPHAITIRSTDNTSWIPQQGSIDILQCASMTITIRQ